MCGPINKTYPPLCIATPTTHRNELYVLNIAYSSIANTVNRRTRKIRFSSHHI